MTPFAALQARLDAGQVIMLDGATGTELQRRGVPMHGFAWSAAALDTHPDIVRAVHEDYIRAGADVIITNTFSTARHVLETAGLGDR
ncbi:MAG TPA: homocysteine S-methyltransferase family protein, partial [Roseiflexaceae bacterium]|nr:homocysteine S-methyltransferase family protein [Roseiflexaceae bacterium]